ncbi:MAG: toll/interleukin-1 receptor domain-containing protein [Erysipelotrichaceae bacterium]|jgi:hypothetical protein|nr:toll/interleukin-1 receptor domain-containing protein [Erysipelotrichaceae bacterium]
MVDMDYFISYSSDIEVTFTDSLFSHLKSLGIKCWYDNNELILGMNIYRNFENVLDSARNWIGSIVIIDDKYFSKEWCKKEISFLIENNVNLLIFLYRMRTEDIPRKFIRILDYHYLCFDDTNTEVFEKIIEKILRHYINATGRLLPHITTQNPLIKSLIDEYQTTQYSYQIIIKTMNIILCLSLLDKGKFLDNKYLNSYRLIVEKIFKQSVTLENISFRKLEICDSITKNIIFQMKNF